jgi:hypothetical protein
MFYPFFGELLMIGNKFVALFLFLVAMTSITKAYGGCEYRTVPKNIYNSYTNNYETQYVYDYVCGVTTEADIESSKLSNQRQQINRNPTLGPFHPKPDSSLTQEELSKLYNKIQSDHNTTMTIINNIR